MPSGSTSRAAARPVSDSANDRTSQDAPFPPSSHLPAPHTRVNATGRHGEHGRHIGSERAVTTLLLSQRYLPAPTGPAVTPHVHGGAGHPYIRADCLDLMERGK